MLPYEASFGEGLARKAFAYGALGIKGVLDLSIIYSSCSPLLTHHKPQALHISEPTKPSMKDLWLVQVQDSQETVYLINRWGCFGHSFIFVYHTGEAKHSDRSNLESPLCLYRRAGAHATLIT